MSRVLLSRSRYRVLDATGHPFANPIRLSFTDSSTTLPKEVYDGPDVGDTSLGTYVTLDGEGYVPESGVWLDVGRYNMTVQERISESPEIWDNKWTINKLAGGTDESTNDDTTIRFVSTIADIRGLSGADLGGITINTGYYTLNDGGQGMWRWNSTSLAADDGGSILKPTGQSEATQGRWIRVFDRTTEVPVTFWGAITGQGDVSGNIEKADLWCGRTATDSGCTLAFPAGVYNIGSAVLDLNRVGVTDVGIARPVHYHLYQNARFAGNGSVNLEGPATIDSDFYVSDILNLGASNVNHGVCRPEWWGAVGDNSNDDSDAFVLCWDQCGSHAIELNGIYLISSDVTITASTHPALHFKGYVSQIKITDGTTTTLDIGKVFTDVNRLLFDGNVDAWLIDSYEYHSSWFDIVSGSDFSTFCGNNETPYSKIVWDSTVTFSDASVYDSDGNMVHKSSDEGIWYINNAYIRLNNCEFSEGDYIIRFASSANTGAFLARNKEVYDPTWFGATGDDVAVQMNHLMRTLVYYERSCDFRNKASNCENAVYLPLVGSSNLSLYNVNFAFTNATDHGLSAGSNSTHPGILNILGGRIVHADQTHSYNTIFVACAYLTMKNVKVYFGASGFDNNNSVISGNEFISTSLNLWGKTAGAYDNVIRDNTLSDTLSYLHVASGVLTGLQILNNTFKYEFTGTGDEQFISIVNDTLTSTVSKVYVGGNYYKNTGTNFDVYNIRDTSDGVTTGWATTAQEIYIEDPQMETDMPYDDYGRVYHTANFVNIHTTNGYAVDGIGSLPLNSSNSTGFWSDEYTLNPNEQFKLTGRGGTCRITGYCVTMRETTSPFWTGKPCEIVQRGEYQGLSNFNNELEITLSFPRGTPWGSEYGSGSVMIRYSFVKDFGDQTA